MNRTELKRILIPSVAQIVICLVLAGLILGITYRDLIGAKYLSHTLFSDPYFKLGSRDSLVRLSGVHAVSLLVQALFWGSVGLVAYVCYLALSNIVVEARNEVVMETAYKNKGSVQGQLVRPLTQIAAALILVLAVLLGLKLLLPVWLQLFEQFLVSGGALVLLESLVGLVATIYLYWTSVQLVLAIG